MSLRAKSSAAAEDAAPTEIQMQNTLQKFVSTLEMIKFSHSIFALPFALISAFFATRGAPKISSLILIILAMITARNTAMSYNRIVDSKIDKLNPRTKDRHIPSGKISLRFSAAFCVVNAILFIWISSFFNQLTLFLSPV